MPVAKSAMGQSFKLSEGVPPLPEDMVAFYESYIPVALEDQPEKIAEAKAALAARDQMLLESILNPGVNDAALLQLKRKPMSLSEDEENELLRDLGYDI